MQVEVSTALPAATEAPAFKRGEVVTSEASFEAQQEEPAAEDLDIVPVPDPLPIPLMEVEMPVEASAEPKGAPLAEQADEQETQQKVETETAEDAAPRYAEKEQTRETMPPHAHSKFELHRFLAGYRFLTNPEFVADEAQASEASESQPPVADAQLSHTQHEGDTADGILSDDGALSGNDASSGEKASSLAS